MSDRNWVSHRKYAKISSQKRRKLILMVTEQNKSIVQSAKQLKIKLSTAKLILKKFKETGTFFDKKMPDYCRRTPRYQLSQHQNDLPPKLEEQSHNLPISGSPQRNGQGECTLGQGEGVECKEEEQAPAMLYFYYFF